MHLSLARRRVDPSREFGRRSSSFGGGASRFARARWRREPRAARRPEPYDDHDDHLATNQSSSRANHHHRRARDTNHQCSFDLCRGWDAHGVGCPARLLAASHPFPTGRSAPLSIPFDGWLVLRRRSTRPSCLAVRVARWGDREDKSQNNSRCRFVDCFNALFQYDRSTRRDPCRRPRQTVVVSFQIDGGFIYSLLQRCG